MRWTRLVPTLLSSVVLTVGLDAQAGGSGSSTGSSSTGGSSTSGTTTTDTTDGGADDNCGTCSDPRAPVEFTDPADGSEVPASTTLHVSVTYDCSCDFCGCFQDQPMSFGVRVDGEQVYACDSACSGSHDVGVMLSPGQHELTATADYSFHSVSDTITVTVAEAATTGGLADGGSGPATMTGGATTNASDGAPSTTEDDAGGAPPTGGCGCTSAPRHEPLAWGWLALLALAVRRRRSPVGSGRSVVY